MDPIVLRNRQIVAVLLFAIVTMQLIYVGLRAGGGDFDAEALWAVEAVAFLLLAVFGLSVAIRGPHTEAHTAIGLAGLLNVAQTGMGIAMFEPVSAGGEALVAVNEAVVGGAFFFYFAAKVLLGFAALVLGFDHMRDAGPSIVALILGGLTGLAGLAALVANIVALGTGLDLTWVAGGTGTLATLLLAVTVAHSVPRFATPRIPVRRRRR